jgi:hypothetical protein
MGQAHARGKRHGMGRRWGFVLVPTCLALVTAELVGAIAVILPPVVAKRVKERRELIDTVAQLGGVSRDCFSVTFDWGNGISTDIQVDSDGVACPTWEEKIALLIQDCFTPLDFVRLGGWTDSELECVVSATDHPETICDANLRAIVRLPVMRDVRSLALAGTSVTDAGLESLASFPSLKTLDVSFTKVSGKGVARLQRAVPNCKITHLQRREAVHGRDFEPKDYRALESLLSLSITFIASCDFMGNSPMNVDHFHTQLSQLNGTLAEVDLDVLSDCLKSQILFYRRSEASAALSAQTSMHLGDVPRTPYGWFEEELFRVQFEEAWKKHYSAGPGRYSRIGVVEFNFDVNAPSESQANSHSQLVSTACFLFDLDDDQLAFLADSCSQLMSTVSLLSFAGSVYSNLP